MAFTKGQVRTVIRSLMSDQAKQAYSDTALDVITQMVLDETVADVIEHAGSWRSQKDNVAITGITTPGYVDLTSAGPLTKRFHRLQSVKKNNQEYSPIDPRDVVMFANVEVVTSTYGYYIEGSKLWMFPLDVNCPIEVLYSYLPALYTGLADTATIDFYDGFEAAFIHEVIARIAPVTTRDDHAIAEAAKSRLISIAKRQRVGPNLIKTYDADIELGGESVQ